MYPKLIIDLSKYRHNVKAVKQLCTQQNISLTAVTKVFCADQKLVDVLNEQKVGYIGDSRLLNFKNMKTTIPKMLLRIPSIHEVEKVVEYTDISLNSELKTIFLLDDVAFQQKRKHKIILMVDIGDLREGMYYNENIVHAVKEIRRLKNIDLIGIGTNLTCYGGIIPTPATLQKLVDLIHHLSHSLSIEFALISGGNSSHVHLLQKNEHIPEINNLRIGEALVLGRETAYGESIENLHQDVITLHADIIELKHKPSVPEGNIGMDAFGKTPHFDDYGLMKRGILAIGKQDVDFHELIPLDTKIRIVGSSSDHIIVDLTHSQEKYEVGSVLKFRLTYGSVLSLMTSQYVVKEYV